jgi:hypothetical protein
MERESDQLVHQGLNWCPGSFLISRQNGMLGHSGYEDRGSMALVCRVQLAAVPPLAGLVKKAESSF